MKTNRILFLLFFHCFVFVGCRQEENNEINLYLQRSVEHEDQQREIFNFVIPDSIDKLLVAAVYYDLNTSAHGIIVYADSSKKEAFNFLFLPDSTVQRDKMKMKKFNEFSSVYANVEYIIRPKAVAIIIRSGSLSNSNEHMRIDNENYY
jgi:hypothetical protein